MYYDANAIKYPECYRERQPLSYIRLFHASPDSPPVDIYANNKSIASNLRFKGFTEYLPLQPGRYNIQIYRSGTRVNPIIDTQITLSPNSIITAAVAGNLSNINLHIIPETIDKVVTGRAYVRFAHLSPNSPSVDIIQSDGKILFRDVEFREYTKYIELKPDSYTLVAKASETNNTLLTIPNVNLKPNRFYTVYAVGLAGGNPPLQVVIPLDGISYLRR